MQSAFFYLFAFLTLLCGVLVIANPFTRNPVTSAMFLVLTIVSMAGLFIQLHAFFLAAEASGSAISRTGWQPRHLVAKIGGQIAGIVPCYLKSHSQGEYVFDRGWADAFERAG